MMKIKTASGWVQVDGNYRSQVEEKTKAQFPQEGNTTTLYVATDENKIYRWDTGTSAYVLVGGSVLTAGTGIKLENDVISANENVLAVKADLRVKSDATNIENGTGVNSLKQNCEAQNWVFANTLYTEYAGQTISVEASGVNSAMFGKNRTEGKRSFAEGSQTVAIGSGSHAEGNNTVAKGNYSHAEGLGTLTRGHYSHAEGQTCLASGQTAHAEGNMTSATANGAHAEGYQTTASGVYSHSEGDNTTASGYCSHAGGQNSTAAGTSSFAHGVGVNANSDYQTVFGMYNNNSYSKLFEIGNGEDNDHLSNAFEVYRDGTAKVGKALNNETDLTVATKGYVDITKSSATNITNGAGTGSIISTDSNNSEATGTHSISIGFNTHATGYCSVAIGDESTAASYYSVAVGDHVTANANRATAFGSYTVAGYANQTVIGKYNDNKSNTLFEVGKGTDASHRSNAFEVHQDGTAKVGAMGTEYLSVATKQYVDNRSIGLLKITTTEASTIASGYFTLNSEHITLCRNENISTYKLDLSDVTIPGISIKTAWMNRLYKDKYFGNNCYLFEIQMVTVKSSNYKVIDTGKIIGIFFLDGTGYVDKLFVFANNQLPTLNLVSGTGERAIKQELATLASGNDSSAFGLRTTASAQSSFAIGSDTTASGNYSHSEGYNTQATAEGSHSEGGNSIASGNYSHAEGCGTIAANLYSHAEGIGTITNRDYQHVSGMYNNVKSNTLFEVGKGTDASHRSNAFEVYEDGTVKFDKLSDGTTTKTVTQVLAGGESGPVDIQIKDIYFDPYHGDDDTLFIHEFHIPNLDSTNVVFVTTDITSSLVEKINQGLCCIRFNYPVCKKSRGFHHYFTKSNSHGHKGFAHNLYRILEGQVTPIKRDTLEKTLLFVTENDIVEREDGTKYLRIVRTICDLANMFWSQKTRSRVDLFVEVDSHYIYKSELIGALGNASTNMNGNCKFIDNTIEPIEYTNLFPFINNPRNDTQLKKRFRNQWYRKNDQQHLAVNLLAPSHATLENNKYCFYSDLIQKSAYNGYTYYDPNIITHTYVDQTGTINIEHIFKKQVDGEYRPWSEEDPEEAKGLLKYQRQRYLNNNLIRVSPSVCVLKENYQTIGSTISTLSQSMWDKSYTHSDLIIKARLGSFYNINGSVDPDKCIVTRFEIKNPKI